MTSRTIYVVDDDDAVRTSLHGFLSLLPNVHVRNYRSGDSFLGELDDHEGGVLLLDFHMPGSSGLDVLKRVSAEKRPFVAVILTGQGSIAIATEAMKAGAADFIEKPYNPNILLDTIERAFRRLEEDSAAASRAGDAAARIDRLSAREQDVLRGLIEGRSNKIIAHDLAISPRTVEIYRANVMDKLEVRSLSEALRIAFAAGMFPEA